jgi:CBS domain-containing protein
MMRVADLMSSPVLTCRGDATLGAIAELLLEHRVHGLVVLDDAGDAAGVVSDFDLLAGEWLATDDESFATMRSMTARELMTSPPVSVDAGADVVEAAALLHSERLARLLVTEGDEPVGVLASSDLVALLGRGRIARATVSDAMSHGIVVCREKTTAVEAARAMTERRTRSLVVVAPHGRPLGVVTSADLLPFVERNAGETRVTELMHEPLTIPLDATLREAADEMVQHEVHRLVVIDPAESDGVPVGLVSSTDIVAEMAAPGSVWGED